MFTEIEGNIRADALSGSRNHQKLHLLAIISIILLIGMTLTVLVSPGEEPSLFELKLEEGEDRIKKVTTSPAGFTTFDMTLTDTRGEGAGTGEVRLEIIDTSYFGGSDASSWEFEFLDAEPGDVYIIQGDEVVTLTLKISFLGSGEGEKVTFSIAGYNTTTSSIETHLSPYDGFGFEYEYLTVFTGEDCEVYWEPTTNNDRMSHYLLLDDSYLITIWNLGTDTDTFWISDWEVWEDVDEDGIINEGSGDVQNKNFEIEFSFMGGEPNDVGDPIKLDSMDNELQRVVVTPDKDRNKVPEGYYLIKISVGSFCGDEHVDTLKAQIDPGQFAEENIEALATILDENPDLDTKDKRNIDRAIDDLERAMRELTKGDVKKAIQRIENSMKDLTKVKAEGIGTQEVIDDLIEFVRSIAENAIVEARLFVEGKKDEKTLQKAIDHFESGLDHFESENWIEVVKEFRNVVNEALKIVDDKH